MRGAAAHDQQMRWSSSNGKVSANAAHLTSPAIPHNDQGGFALRLIETKHS
jgi:hypothetical protein